MRIGTEIMSGNACSSLWVASMITVPSTAVPYRCIVMEEYGSGGSSWKRGLRGPGGVAVPAVDRRADSVVWDQMGFLSKCSPAPDFPSSLEGSTPNECDGGHA